MFVEIVRVIYLHALFSLYFDLTVPPQIGPNYLSIYLFIYFNKTSKNWEVKNTFTIKGTSTHDPQTVLTKYETKGVSERSE